MAYVEVCGREEVEVYDQPKTEMRTTKAIKEGALLEILDRGMERIQKRCLHQFYEFEKKQLTGLRDAHSRQKTMK